MAKLLDPAIATGLAAYAMALDSLMRTYHEAHYSHPYEPIVVELRQKYARVVHCRSNPTSIANAGHVLEGKAPFASSSYAYVDLATGTVLKGNWKGVEIAVAHISRGSILDGSWLDWHGPHGIGYVDGHGEFRRMLTDADYMVATDAIRAGDVRGAAATLAAAIVDFAEVKRADAAIKATPDRHIAI